MNILILGSGGREHALAWKISQSPLLKKLYVAPGNAGIAEIADNVDIKAEDFDAIRTFVLEKEIDMVVVGPEDPLVKGIADYFLADPDLRKVRVIGPGKEGARLEGSKEFAKKFMENNHIPTARYKSFTRENIREAYAFLESFDPPYVLKADGLAAGKGVVIPHTLEEAKKELKGMLEEEKFGAASSRVVIEEYLNGIELSVFVLTDGKNYVMLPNAKDYKRIGEGDTGLNTGGMGAISPVPFADGAFMKKVEDRIVRPTIKGLETAGLDYKGFVFIGLMAVGGDPFVIEYNVRLGDPETEVVVPRIKNDLLELLLAVHDGRLAEMKVALDERFATTVMLVSGGYPESYEKGKKMTGFQKVKESLLFHAGTRMDGNDILTNGGRVIAVTSYGRNKEEALEKSYENVARIRFDKQYYRKDIGFDL